MLRDCADAIPDEDLSIECERFLGGLLNSDLTMLTACVRRPWHRLMSADFGPIFRL